MRFAYVYKESRVWQGRVMKAIRSILNFALFVVVVWGAISAVHPFWNKYWLQKQMEGVAIYGTKNSVEDTREFLKKQIEGAGYHVNWDNVAIEKNEENDISIRMVYRDEIEIFGVSLKTFEFQMDAFAREVEGIF